MAHLLMRALKPALAYSLPIIGLWLFLGWISGATVIFMFALLLFWHWLFLEVDFDEVKNAKKNDDMLVCVVGTGFSGVCMGIKLKKAGIPFIILEKCPSVGGTWYKNNYPGATVDIPSDLYQYSFFMNTKWTKKYAERDEILG